MGLLPIERLPVIRVVTALSREPITIHCHASVTISFCIGPVTVALAIADEHVDLGPYAEFWRVDAGLDREPGAGDQAALVVRLVVVHVTPLPCTLAEAVAGAMNELRAEAGAIDHVSRRAIDFEAAELAPCPRRALTSSTAGVAPVPGRRKHPRILRRAPRAR